MDRQVHPIVGRPADQRSTFLTVNGTPIGDRMDARMWTQCGIAAAVDRFTCDTENLETGLTGASEPRTLERSYGLLRVPSGRRLGVKPGRHSQKPSGPFKTRNHNAGNRVFSGIHSPDIPFPGRSTLAITCGTSGATLASVCK